MASANTDELERMRNKVIYYMYVLKKGQQNDGQNKIGPKVKLSYFS